MIFGEVFRVFRGLYNEYVLIYLGYQFITKMCRNQVFLDALSTDNICDSKCRPTKIVTLLPRIYWGTYLTLLSSESSKDIENRISMHENLF